MNRPWGWYIHLFWCPWLWVKLIRVLPGHRTSMQFHLHRAELHLRPLLWRSVYVPAMAIHRMTEGWVIELAWGWTNEEDIVRIEDDYDRLDD